MRTAALVLASSLGASAACGDEFPAFSESDGTSTSDTGPVQPGPRTATTDTATTDTATESSDGSPEHGSDSTDGSADEGQTDDTGAARPAPGFVDVTEDVGLYAESGGGLSVPPFCLLTDISTPGGGDYCFPQNFLGAAAAGDFDGDGWVDLYITRRSGSDRLLRNVGGNFVDVTAAAGLSVDGEVGAAAWADFDNDGDLDLMLTGVGTTRHFLFIGDGEGHFSEQAEPRGAAVATKVVHVGMGIGIGDFDLDGWLDVFVADWRPTAKLGAADHNRLLRGVGSAAPGSFHDVTDTLPFSLAKLASVVDAKPGEYGFAPSFIDLDDDGWPELTLTADFGTSRLLWNEGGRFADTTWESGVGTERNGMGSTFADYDGDGDIDWFVSAIWTDEFPWLGHRLYENLGDRTFEDVAIARTIHDAGWGWGASWLDYDNDGDPDLAMAAGWPGLGYDEDPLRLWENTGAGVWSDQAEALGIEVVGDGRGLVPLDFDNDGDLDLLVVGSTGSPRLFRNDVAQAGWLVVRTEGTVSNRQGIGARVSVWTDDDSNPAVAHITANTQLMGQPAAEARFGLGDDEGPVRVEVTFPASGITHELIAVERNQVVVVVE